MTWRQLILPALLLSCHMQGASGAVREMTGYASDPETNQLVYTEQHRIVEDRGKPVSHRVQYFLPDGTEFARKELSYLRDPYAPQFHFRDERADYVEGGGPTDAGYEVHHIKEDGEKKSKLLETVNFRVADTGFNGYMRDHMALILKGNVLRFHLAVPGRLNQYEFQVKVKSYLKSLGRRAVELEVAPTNMLLRTLAAPLLLHYDMETRELLVWEGSTNIINPATGKRDRLRVEFPLDQNRIAGTQEELDDPGDALEDPEEDAAESVPESAPDQNPAEPEPVSGDAPQVEAPVSDWQAPRGSSGENRSMRSWQ